MKDNIFITGATGMLANHFYDESKYHYKPTLIHYKKEKIDNKYIKLNYHNKNEIKKIFLKYRPSFLIHTAGITSVEICERNKKNTLKINYEITKNLADICKQLGINLIYISSDHLFNGSIYTGYSELSKTNPLNLYAKTKILSENYIKKKLKKYLIVRTNFFGKGNKFKKSFSDRIITSLKKNKKIKLFDDVYFNPISMNELSKVVLKLIEIKKFGTFNIVTDQKINKYQFGIKIANYLNLNSKLIIKSKIDKMKLVLRPKSMFLKNKKIKKIIKYKSNINSNMKYI